MVCEWVLWDELSVPLAANALRNVSERGRVAQVRHERPNVGIHGEAARPSAVGHDGLSIGTFAYMVRGPACTAAVRADTSGDRGTMR